MDISTILGVFTGIIVLCAAILSQGSLIKYWSMSSVLIVLGGTISAFMVSYPLDKLKSSLKIIKKAFIKETYDLDSTIEQLGELSLIAKKSGLLALEKNAKDLDNKFLKKSILLIVDGVDPKVIEKMLTLDVNNMITRHNEGIGMMKTLGKLSPAMGMMGTVIGLIAMLKGLDDPSTIGPAMGVALITTLYGSLLANMVYIPIAGKLKYKSDKEVMYKLLIIEGILSVQSGESPLMIKEKLKTFMEEKSRERKKEV